LACERHLRDLTALAAQGYRWDVERVERFQRFVGQCRHPAESGGGWAGQPIELLDWQWFVLGSLVGWVAPTGYRRFRWAYIEVPTGQGKSTMLAVLVLYLCFYEGEAGAQGYTLAPKLDQARIVYDMAHGVASASEWMLAEHDKGGTLRQFGGDGPKSTPLLRCDVTRSRLRPLPSNARLADGFAPWVVCYDEVHEGQQGLWDKVTSKMVKRMPQPTSTSGRGPLAVAITTAGDNLGGFGWRLRSLHERVLRGTLVDDSRFGFITTADEGVPWASRQAIEQACPSAGTLVQVEPILAELEAAKGDAAMERNARRMYLNHWVRPLRKVWVNIEAWDRCPRLDDGLRATLAGRSCWGGLDMSSSRDMTAWVLRFPLADGRVAVLAWMWAPEKSTARRDELNEAMFRDWSTRGHLTLCPGSQIDYQAVRRVIQTCADEFRIISVGYDRYNARDIGQWLQAEMGVEVVEIGQGMADMAEATAAATERVRTAGYVHEHNPCLRWMVDNAQVIEDRYGNRRIVKPMRPSGKSDAGVDETRKVDGPIALVMAEAVSLGQQVPDNDARASAFIELPEDW
jgi:phage terminase large subunit-like protein